MRRATLILVVLALLMGGGRTNADGVLGLDFANGAPYDYGYNSWNLGYSFTVNSPVTVIALGNVDLQQNGFGGNGPQQVGLWDSSGNLLASTYVPTTGSEVGVNNDWLFNPITPVVLTPGQSYVVGGQGGADYAGETPVNVNPSITFTSDLYTFNGGASSPLVEPTSSEGFNSPSVAGWFGGNVEFAAVPEPTIIMSIWSLLGTLGLGLGLGWRRKRNAV